jgi:hypothetical protein
MMPHVRSRESIEDFTVYYDGPAQGFWIVVLWEWTSCQRPSNRSILVFSFGSGTIGHDGGMPVDADFDLIRDERIEIHAPALAILQILCPGLDVAQEPRSRKDVS